MPTLATLSLPELRQHAVETFREGKGSRPDVLLIKVGGECAVLKDHNECDPWFARLIGPLLVMREARALRRLQGISGIPELIGRPDSRALLLEYLPANPITQFSADVDWRTFFDDLRNMLHAMHARGVAHCDLRSPKNTLIDLHARPAVVDFVAHIGRTAPWNLVGTWIFARFARADLDALIKLKSHVAPELVEASEQLRINQHTKLERGARWLGIRIRNLSRRLFTR